MFHGNHHLQHAIARSLCEGVELLEEKGWWGLYQDGRISYAIPELHDY